MRTFTIIVLLICLAIQAKAQHKELDSLDHLISKAGSDTSRINLIREKLNILSNVNLDSAITLAEQTLPLARKINYYKGEVSLRLKLATNYCFKGEYDLADEHLDFLETFIQPSKDSSDFADVYGARGMMSGMQSKYDSSIIFYKQAIGIRERAGTHKSLAAYYSNIAIAYQQQSNFPEALQYQQKALGIATENKDQVNEAYTTMNMANTYSNMEDPARAEMLFLKAIELAKKKSLINVELYGYSNLASIYVLQNRWQQAYEFAIKAASLGKSMGDKGIEAASLSKAATALAYTHKPAEAQAMAKKAIAIADSSAQPLNIYQAYSSMGGILKLNGSYAAAIPYFEKGFLSMKESDIYDINYGDDYNALSECYEKTGNFIKALETYKISAQISDSVRTKDNIRKATELTMNYEFEKERKILEAEQKSKDAIARTKQLGLIVGLGVTFVLAIVAFLGFKNKQTANALLKQKTEEIESTLTQLKSAQSQLIQSEKMASLGELTAAIAHEIQNPLNFVNNFSEVSTELVDDMNVAFDEGNSKDAKRIGFDLAQNMQKILHHGKRASDIVKGMLLHSRTDAGAKESTDINALTSEYVRLAYYGLRAKDKSFTATVKTDLDSSVGIINIVPQDIGRVVLNLVNNAFYAIHERSKQQVPAYEPEIIVSTKKKDNNILISVKDNGNGIPESIKDKIFNPFFTTKPAGDGTGLGLSLSYDIVKAHGGGLKVASSNETGTEFIIELPRG